ncbi:helix-turn-helix domain-containing protein [Lysinibacillus sp. OTC-L20]|uniref:helix-turn-helix domain-containing protein n=1 Tax=Lysinibacillus sp. OTC-L20 TaxID=3342791 RepID=UPI0035B8F996
MVTMQQAIQNRLIELMNEKKWTVTELARQASLNQSTVNYIVKAGVKNPSVQALYQISRAFGITLSEFFNSPHFEDITLEAMKAGRSKQHKSTS